MLLVFAGVTRAAYAVDHRKSYNTHTLPCAACKSAHTACVHATAQTNTPHAPSQNSDLRSAANNIMSSTTPPFYNPTTASWPLNGVRRATAHQCVTRQRITQKFEHRTQHHKTLDITILTTSKQPHNSSRISHTTATGGVLAHAKELSCERSRARTFSSKTLCSGQQQRKKTKKMCRSWSSDQCKHESYHVFKDPFTIR
jgi:hypothetical protein